MSDKIIKCSADEPSIFGYGLHEVTSSLPLHRTDGELSCDKEVFETKYL